MRPEASALPAPPLTVWVGPTRYVFAPGRDVLVGYGSGVDIPLGPSGHPAPPHPDVVLRFTGRHWVAIDNSPRGMFVNGSRVPTVDIHSGQAITIGDPQRGPRLVFQLDPPAAPPGRPPAPPPRPAQPSPPQPSRNRPNDPNLRAPTERGTQPIRIPPPQPPGTAPPGL
ncbi:FHA domain-containing protein, partial [Mycobacterium sp. E2327]|uniref:FHA domain-containing protein n=1 Tax=Mycobacterium sp. E2327 TaxID=1834132 RepID=UPI003513DAF5